MISHLDGAVAARDAGTVVIDVHGVGYLVHVTPGERIPARGERVQLHTSMQVREESMTLYGFAERSTLVLFELLLTSSGVGPKLALAALGTHRPEVLRTAIAASDLPTLTQIPGVGKKVAERLVLELKDKVGALPDAVVADPAAAPTGTTAEDGTVADARDALLALGYTGAEVTDALARVAPSEDDDTQRILRAALGVLGGSSPAGVGG